MPNCRRRFPAQAARSGQPFPAKRPFEPPFRL